MSTLDRKLMFRFDIPRKGASGEACLLVYQIGDGFLVVATAADNGDAEVFLTRDEFKRFQRQLSEIIP